MSQENIEIVRRCYAALDRRVIGRACGTRRTRTSNSEPSFGVYLGTDEAQAFIEDALAAFDSWASGAETDSSRADDQVVVLHRHPFVDPGASSGWIKINARRPLDLSGWDGPDAFRPSPNEQKALEAAGLSSKDNRRLPRLASSASAQPRLAARFPASASTPLRSVRLSWRGVLGVRSRRRRRSDRRQHLESSPYTRGSQSSPQGFRFAWKPRTGRSTIPRSYSRGPRQTEHVPCPLGTEWVRRLQPPGRPDETMW